MCFGWIEHQCKQLLRRLLAMHFSHSVVATVSLKEKQNQMKYDAEKLINSCATK